MIAWWYGFELDCSIRLSRTVASIFFQLGTRMHSTNLDAKRISSSPKKSAAMIVRLKCLTANALFIATL